MNWVYLIGLMFLALITPHLSSDSIGVTAQVAVQIVFVSMAITGFKTYSVKGEV